MFYSTTPAAGRVESPEYPPGGKGGGGSPQNAISLHYEQQQQNLLSPDEREGGGVALGAGLEEVDGGGVGVADEERMFDERYMYVHVQCHVYIPYASKKTAPNRLSSFAASIYRAYSRSVRTTLSVLSSY